MQTTLKERVQDRMGVMGLTNVELAKACKVKPPTSFNWASGKTKNIKGVPLLLAAKALGVTPEWLASGIGTKYPASEAGQHRVEEDTPHLSHLPSPKQDKFTTEVLALLAQLDSDGKSEVLSYIRGFVEGRRPHKIGTTSAMAG